MHEEVLIKDSSWLNIIIVCVDENTNSQVFKSFKKVDGGGLSWNYEKNVIGMLLTHQGLVAWVGTTDDGCLLYRYGSPE